MSLKKLQNAIKFHLELFGGPSGELSVYTLKLIDLFECTDTDRDIEFTLLSHNILISCALKIHQYVGNGNIDTSMLREVIEETRNSIINRDISDSIYFKMAAVMSKTFNDLSILTKAKYPSLNIKI